MLTTSYAQDATTLNESGVLPPKLVTHLNTASSELKYAVSPRTGIRWGVAVQRFSFVASPIPSGSTYTTGLNATRQISRSQTVGLAVEYQRAATVGTAGNNGGVFGVWQQAIGKDVTVDATGGLRLYTLPGRGALQTAPGGSVGFTARPRPDHTLGVRYDRLIEQALGSGTHLGNQVTASYTVSLNTHLSVNAGGSYGQSIFPLDPSHQRTGQTATIGARWILVRNMALSLGYVSYKRLDTQADAPNPAISGHTAMLSLTYGRAW
jgi:hypothetical protein